MIFNRSRKNLQPTVNAPRARGINTPTSWEGVSSWYDESVESPDSYQKTLILPNLLRLANLKKEMRVLDLACGQGFFAREIAPHVAEVVGTDVSQSLIKIAREKSPGNISWHISRASSLPFVRTASMDLALCILAIQNIDNPADVLREVSRVLKSSGRLLLVLNHPAFRVPKKSSWGWDEKDNVQYRRVDGYLSESKVKIQMHPGDDPSIHTLTFHRPLQYYAKLLRNAGFVIAQMEEWNSKRVSQPGPRARAENIARQEIPMFLFLEVVKRKY